MFKRLNLYGLPYRVPKQCLKSNYMKIKIEKYLMLHDGKI